MKTLDYLKKFEFTRTDGKKIYEIIKEKVDSHRVDNNINVRTVSIKKPRGRQTYLAVCQETLTGEMLNYKII